MTQRGFIALPLMWWAAIGAGAVILCLGVAVKVQTARVGALHKELAYMESSRDLWKDAAETCSKATAEAAAEAQKRARKAQDALAKAQEASGNAESEIARLRSAKPSGAACPAGEAVWKVREGLK